MEEKIIVLDVDTYQRLLKVVNSDQQNINFKCGNTSSMFTIPNKTKIKPSSGQNIVQRWMNDIVALAEEGLANTHDAVSIRCFTNIKSYCAAVIVSATS